MCLCYSDYAPYVYLFIIQYLFIDHFMLVVYTYYTDGFTDLD